MINLFKLEKLCGAIIIRHFLALKYVFESKVYEIYPGTKVVDERKSFLTSQKLLLPSCQTTGFATMFI